jgi:MFS family permease
LLDLRLYGPFAIIYFSEVAGSYALGMSVFATTQLTSALLEVPTGVLSDRAGRRITMISGAFLSVLAICAYAAASGELLLFVGAVLEGTSRALFSGNNAALLHDSLTEDGSETSYHHHFGRIGSMSQAGLAIGALLGGIIGYWSLMWVFWLSVIPQLAAWFISLGLQEPHRTHSLRSNGFGHLWIAIKHIARTPRLAWLTVAQSVSFGFGEANFQFVTAFHRTLWPIWAIGALRTAAHGLAALGFWFAGPVIDRYSHLRVLIVGSALGQFFHLLGLWLTNLWSPAIMTVPSLLYGLNQTAKNHLLQQDFTDEQRATLGSVVSLAGSLMFVVAAIGAGVIADTWGPLVALTTLLSIHLLVIPIYSGLFRSR